MDPGKVDPCTFMVDPSIAFLADDPTKLMVLVPLVDTLPLSNPKPILQLVVLTLRTSSNTINKNVNDSPRYRNDNETGQFRNQRTVTVAGARETVGNQVVQQTGIQFFDFKEFGHFAKECRKPKRAKDFTYHKEKMLMCKQAKKVEKVNSNVIPDLSDMYDNDNQTDKNAKKCDDEHVVLANLIANLKLDTDENKKIQNQLKKANTSLSYELKECKSALKECKSSLEESNIT
uniref:Uncharacterized protein n=1 Tax=Tanacetum cinerariifolium TaxID=118510 RepID=A0A699H4L8_TANCI|nr:hypothetical protein [Tanacetum cinerariifolium]